MLPGRPSQGKAQRNVSDSAVGPCSCEVSDVTRTSSGSQPQPLRTTATAPSGTSRT